MIKVILSQEVEPKADEILSDMLLRKNSRFRVCVPSSTADHRRATLHCGGQTANWARLRKRFLRMQVQDQVRPGDARSGKPQTDLLKDICLRHGPTTIKTATQDAQTRPKSTVDHQKIHPHRSRTKIEPRIFYRYDRTVPPLLLCRGLPDVEVNETLSIQWEVESASFVDGGKADRRIELRLCGHCSDRLTCNAQWKSRCSGEAGTMSGRRSRR